jgi:transcriptional regulator with XRE-family HTH domain
VKTVLSGQKLKQEIQRVGIPKAELARRCGTTRQSIHSWCESAIQPASPGMLERLAQALGCGVGALVVEVRE